MRIVKMECNQVVVEFDDGLKILFSYKTPVAGFKPGLGYFQTDRFYSSTTNKHIYTYLGRVEPTIIPQWEIMELVGGK